VRALNRALATLPAGSVRLHVCWGNYEGPHHLDVPLEAILPVLLQARVGAFVLSMANPRHAHEYRLLNALPASASVVAGVIDTTTNYVEHPMVVADRLETVASALGDPRRVMAGTDCGFATTAGMSRVAREVVWEKLRALVEGARIASERLF
jgi:5-methyltetrahydropteroyltriglutamate--homocysteine methyltransferase